jgi:hypothetical protein
MPKECQENDDRNRDAYKPKQRTSTKAHINLHAFVSMSEHRTNQKVPLMERSAIWKINDAHERPGRQSCYS